MYRILLGLWITFPGRPAAMCTNSPDWAKITQQKQGLGIVAVEEKQRE